MSLNKPILSFKDALSFPINTFHTQYILRNGYTYIMINASNLMKKSVLSFEEKTTQHTFKLLARTKHI